jgi:Xaa-Pro dipeptidase
MHAKVPSGELSDRLRRFHERMAIVDPDWELAIISSNVNLYYFTGTMQDGILVIPRHGDAVLWVRRSFSRAVDESGFPRIQQMQSYRTAAEGMGTIPRIGWLETEHMTLAQYQRLRKYFTFEDVRSVDPIVADLRSAKTPYERRLMERAGSIHPHVLEDLAPALFREGMSEADFSAELYAVMVREGHHGIVRFGIAGAEIMLGLIGFGESSIYPTYLDSPGGNAGMSPAVPLLGSRDRKLRKGDLIFCDIGCGYHGYHTDKTMTYVFGGTLPDEVVRIHQQCVGIQDAMVALLNREQSPRRFTRR